MFADLPDPQKDADMQRWHRSTATPSAAAKPPPAEPRPSRAAAQPGTAACLTGQAAPKPA